MSKIVVGMSQLQAANLIQLLTVADPIGFMFGTLKADLTAQIQVQPKPQRQIHMPDLATPALAGQPTGDVTIIGVH